MDAPSLACAAHLPHIRRPVRAAGEQMAFHVKHRASTGARTGGPRAGVLLALLHVKRWPIERIACDSCER